MNRLASKISELLDETRTNFRDFLSEIFDDFCVFTHTSLALKCRPVLFHQALLIHAWFSET